MNTYLYREKKIKSLFSKKTNTFRASLEKKSFDVGTLPVPFLKSRASKEVTSRWPVSSGQQSARVDLSLLARCKFESGEAAKTSRESLGRSEGEAGRETSRPAFAPPQTLAARFRLRICIARQ